MEWNYSECGADSEEDSNVDHQMSSSFSSEQTEVLQVLRQTLELPKGLCANPNVFWEFFSAEHLWDALPADTKNELMDKHLPQFPADTDNRKEQEATIQSLFQRETFQFNTSPLVDFQRQLEEGNYLSDVVQYRAKIAKSERHERRYQECEYVSRLASKLAESRKLLLQRLDGRPDSSHMGHVSDQDATIMFAQSVACRARKRYLKEIAFIKSDAELPLSDSEGEDESYGNNTSKYQSKVARKPGRPPNAQNAMPTDLTEHGEPKVYGTFAYKPRNMPTQEGPSEICLNDEYLRRTLRRHKKRKNDESDHRVAALDNVLDDLFSAAPSPMQVKSKRSKTATKGKKIKTENKSIKAATIRRSNSTQSPIPPTISGGPRDSHGVNRINGQPAAKRLKPSKESSKSQMITTEFVKDSMEAINAILVNMGNQPHACFMSLVRSIFCATPDHRSTFENLRKIAKSWLARDNGGSAWSSDCHSWLDELPSVLKFLVGEFAGLPEDYVPYIEYKVPLQIYQWIGAGRDTDQHLVPLNRLWLENRHQFKKVPAGKTAGLSKGHAVTTKASSHETNESSAETIAPARCPTAWTVRPERADEVALFRSQEKQRYENPSCAFTYRLHGYESSVGPVAGIYAQVLNRGLNLLTTDRPPSVTLMSLVRDAVARLPNGEGTKAHVCELLKASQYVVPGSVLHVTVAAVLERLQRDTDGCVVVDNRRKMLVYRLRASTEAELRKPQMTTTTSTVYKRTIATDDLQKVKVMDTSTRKVVSLTPNRNNSGTVHSYVPSPTGNNNPLVTVANRTQQAQMPNSVYKIRTTKVQTGGTEVKHNSHVNVSINNRLSSTGQRGGVYLDPSKDLEAHLDSKHPPAMISKMNFAKTPIKFSTVVGNQTQPIGGGQPRQMVLTTSQGQSVLMHSPRTVKVSSPITTTQIVGMPSSVVSVVEANKQPPVISRTVAMLPSGTKVIRARPSGSPLAVTSVPKKTVTVNQSTLAAAFKSNAIQKTVQVNNNNINNSPTTSSPLNSGNSVLRAGNSLLTSANKPMLQNIVIRSGGPQQVKRTVPLKSYSAVDGTAMQSILVSNANAGDVTGSNTNTPSFIKIRTSTANQLLLGNGGTGNPAKSMATAGGAQIVQIQSATAGGNGQPQKFFINSNVNVTNAMQQIKATSSAAALNKHHNLTVGAQQVIQLPQKTMIKGAPVPSTTTARMLKTVTVSMPQGSSGTPSTPTIVRTVSGLTNRVSPGSLVTLVDAAGSAKAASSPTTIRVAKASQGKNVIQLAATNGGTGPRYTVLSPGRNVIQIQSPAAAQKATSILGTRSGSPGDAGSNSLQTKPSAIRMVNAANITRIGGGKPVLISNKLAGNVTSLVRGTLATPPGAKAVSSSTAASTSPSGSSSTNLVIGGQNVKVPSTLGLNNSSAAVVGRSSSGQPMQHVMIGNQLVKIQSAGGSAERGKQVVLNANLLQNQEKMLKTVTGTVVKTGAQFKPGQATAGTPNRVVFVQGPQGQLLLPSNLQGGSINLKSLKMISVQSSTPQQQPQSSPQPK